VTGIGLPEKRHSTPLRSLLVVSQSLGGGGAERVITILLRDLDRERFRPSLALFSREGAFLEGIPGDVPVFGLGEQSSYNVFRTAARLSRVIRSARPSVILGVLNHPNLVTLAVCRAFFRDIPVVIRAGDNLSLSLKKDRGRHLKRFLHRCFYPHARRVIAVSCGVKDDLERRFGIPGDQIQVIYNPCEIDRIQRLAREQPDLPIDWSIPTVVVVGRLTEQKGFGYLLQAFTAVAQGRPCQLLILGEGEDRPALSRQATALGIADRILMPGFQANPFAYMARSHVFVLSSLWEGFPNVIVDAMACGIPVVSTDCPFGPSEIITHSVNGLLVPPADAGTLATAIKQVLMDQAMAKRLSEAGRVRVHAFSPAIIVRQYEEALAETML
jgi:glycosyltransferase involved in cell wall biosynthesis